MDILLKMTCFYSPSFTLILALLFSTSFASNSRQSSLYSEGDPLYELDASNFNRTVLGKNNAWIIEFYNNWCGHCIRFVPIWKKFAQDTSAWNRVIDVGVVNCNDPQNVKLCRQYEIESFPTIRMFWHHTAGNDTGVIYAGKRDISSIEKGVVDFLESHWDKGVPPDWPDIQPLPMETLDSITDSMPDVKQSMMAFVESPGSYTGRLVILDLSFKLNVVIKRILTTSERLMSDLNIEVSNSTIPTFIRIYRNNYQMPLFRFSQDTNATYIRDQIFEYLTGKSRQAPIVEDEHPEEEPEGYEPIPDAVSMTDLENAVRNALSREIGVSKVIEGEKLTTVKAFLSVLKTYFPGSSNVMGYLSKLHSWVESKGTSIPGEEFVDAMQKLETKEEFLPPMRDWVACKGSQPQYRGYPCSLWTLFHTLTVQASKKIDEVTDGPKGKEVLFIIRDYVKNIFSCEECVQHFLRMAENVESEVKTSNDAVLWLWEGHNKANKRLAGDLTEDPKHPKIQFPSKDACPKCQTTDDQNEIVWDKAVVLQFLLKYYDKKNILSLHNAKVKDSSVAQIQANNSAMVNTFKNTSLSEKWSFQWFTSTDISLCVSLYLVSAILIIIIFLLFRQRRRRRKFQFGKYLSLYP